MAFLLELKDKLQKFYYRHDVSIVPATKFVIAFVALLMVNKDIGYMSAIKNPLILLIAAILCAFTPGIVTILVLSAVILLHLYAVSAELALIVLGVMVIMYLSYFRFSPRTGYLLILTAICCWLKIPYIIPIVAALYSSAYMIFPVGFGVAAYYTMQTISSYEASLTKQTIADSAHRYSYIVESFMSNREMLVLLISFTITIIVVYLVRRLSVNNAWEYAIIAGMVTQLASVFVTDIIFLARLNLVLVVAGTLAGALVAYVWLIFLFNLDYKRAERVQFEDEEYYYYVKAVPKRTITGEEVKVTHINAKKIKDTTDAASVIKPAMNEPAAGTEENRQKTGDTAAGETDQTGHPEA